MDRTWHIGEVARTWGWKETTYTLQTYPIDANSVVVVVVVVVVV